MENAGDSTTPGRTTLYVNLAGLRADVQAVADAEHRTLTNATGWLLTLGLEAYRARTQQTTPGHAESRRTTSAGSR